MPTVAPPPKSSVAIAQIYSKPISVMCFAFFFHHKMNTFNFYFVRVKKAKPVRLVNHMVPSSLVTPLRNVLCELLAPFVTMLPKMLCSSAMEALGCHL